MATFVHLRAYPAQIERTGPRQLSGRLVPYGEVTEVADELPDGKFDIYQEGFRPGAFPQAGAHARIVTKVGLIHRHEGGLGFLGPFVSLREQPDGLYGEVAVMRSRAGDVEDLLAAGVDQLSVEFRLPGARHTEIDANGVRWRTRAHLDQVALEPKGAYDRAEVLAYRAEVDEVEAQVEAERQQAAEFDDRERRLAAEQAEAEAEARRRRWEELTGRLDGLQTRQDELITRYGLTRAGGLRPTLDDAHRTLDGLRRP